MIARILILLLLVLLLPQFYFDQRKRRRRTWWQRLLWWLPVVAMSVWTVVLAFGRDFVPEDMTWTNAYLLVLGVLFVPRAGAHRQNPGAIAQ